MGFFGDGVVVYGFGFKVFYDCFNGFYFFEGNRFLVLEI